MQFRQAKKLQQAVTTATTICIHMGLISPLLPTQSRLRQSKSWALKAGESACRVQGDTSTATIDLLELIRAAQTFSKW